MLLEKWVRNRYNIVTFEIGFPEPTEHIMWGNKLTGTHFSVFSPIKIFLKLFEGKVDMDGSDEEILQRIKDVFPNNEQGYNDYII
ncbi:hypothetical protein [Paenibacillus sp. Z3-2]